MSAGHIGRIRLKPTNVVHIKAGLSSQSPDSALLRAVGELSQVAIAGFTTDGDLYFDGGNATCERILWLLARAQHRLMTEEER